MLFCDAFGVINGCWWSATVWVRGDTLEEVPNWRVSQYVAPWREPLLTSGIAT